MLKVDAVRIDGWKMNYMSFGEGKRNFVILPGLSVQNVTPLAEQIAAQYRILADDYTVWLFDRKEQVSSGYSTEDMARDTYAAMQTLGIEQADFLGISQGGMIAISLAVQFPAAVRKLALGSAADMLTDELREACLGWIALAEQGDSAGLALNFAEKFFSDSLCSQYHDYFANTTYQKKDLDRFVILTEAILHMDLRAVSPTVSCPIFVIGSTADRVMGFTNAKTLADRLHAESYLYGAPYGHAVYDEAPDYLEHVLHFFKK